MQIRNKPLVAVFWLVLALHLRAQTNATPARLAIVGDSPETAPIVDVLTAEFSKDDRVQLLERAEIEKVLHEQQLSLNNVDGLKLGRLLGADGLLLLGSTMEGTNQNLDTRLVAVKPGVVLTAEKFLNPKMDLAGWSSHFAGRLSPMVNKLNVLAKDAIPISVVNFRSAISSADAPETERQIQTLVIQRLSHEPQFFVLERQRMQQLVEEKQMSADEGAFWNGAWLLEGTIDQNGFSKDTITVGAQLVPPKGGAPVPIEVSGSRTNFSEVINQLAVKVAAALKITPIAKEWNAADEAAHFFDEAQWAQRWGALQEAQMAADAAWALGKKDLDCALLRVRARTGQIPMLVSPGVRMSSNGRMIHTVTVTDPPDGRYCDLASEALEGYAAFSRTSSDGEAKVLTRGGGWNDWHGSDWYAAGLDALNAASSVLAEFNHSPESQKSAADKLADLRAEARSVAKLIAEAPSVHDSYYVSNRLVTYDELVHTIQDQPNIFSTMINWGCYWQERPEDAIALYRELMVSPVYCYIQGGLWHREGWRPRLVAWDDEGWQRIPRIWADFIRELDGSTNLLGRLEGHALQLADIKDEQKAAVAFTNFFEEIFSNRAELVADPVEVVYPENWNGEILSKDPGGSDIYSPIRDRLGNDYYSSYLPQLQKMEMDYRTKTVAAAKVSAVIERQKKFLRDNEPYDFTTFEKVFEERAYSPAQAQEILTLIIAYKSNLLARAEGGDRGRESMAQGEARSVEIFLQRDVENIAHPAPPPVKTTAAPPPAQNTAATPPPPVRAAVPLKPEVTSELQAPAAVTNVIPINKFLEIPVRDIPGYDRTEIYMTGHRWVKDSLILDFQLGAYKYISDQNGKLIGTSTATIPAVAVLDVDTERWQVVPGSEVDILAQNKFYHRTTLWHGQIYTSDDNRIRRYDASTNGWHDLEIPDVGNCELFTVNDHLYAANYNLIVEILGDDSTRILASNRRQPPVSAIDTENFGTPTLFAGPGGTLRVVLASKIYSWDETNWNLVCAAPSAPRTPEISDEAVLLFGDGWNTDAGIWRLPAGTDQVEYCLGQPRETGMVIGGPPRPKKPKPHWNTVKEFRLERLAAASHGPDLYVLAGRAKTENIVDEQQHDIIGRRILPQDGCHAELFCFSSNFPAPQNVYLKFDATDTTVPVGNDSDPRNYNPLGSPATWMFIHGNKLFISREVPREFDPGATDHQKAGVWVTSLEQIDAEVERQKKIQAGQLARKSDAQKSAYQALLAQYDWNHDGVIDGEEKEAALTNKDYIASQLDLIDTNQNGVLNADELKFFDANSNNILDRNERTGIEITQRLLAERLVKKYDDDGNGLLDRREFGNLVQDCVDQNARHIMVGNSFPDENRDNFIDVEEVKGFIERLTRPQPTRGMPGQSFKMAVESYWQNGGKVQPFSTGSMPPFGHPTSNQNQ